MSLITLFLILTCGRFGFVSPVQAVEPVPAPTRVHDPAMIDADGFAYVVSTGRGIPIRRSRDLTTWESVGMVFPDNIPEWAKAAVPRARELWAPDISKLGAEYRVYYSVSSFGSQRSVIGLATNTTLDPAQPGYRWVDRGLVVESNPGRDHFNAIDPNVVLDEHDRPWLTFGSFWGGLQLVPLDPSSGKPDPADSAPPRTIAARPGEHAIEAPFLYRRGGWFYLFASVDHCCRGVDSDYKVIVGRSRRVDGPFLDLDGHSMVAGGGTTVIASSGTIRGPGHNAIARLNDGTEAFVHHFYDADNRGTSKLQVRRVVWGMDGFPLAGEEIAGQGPSLKLAPEALARDLADSSWDLSRDFADPQPIRLRDEGQA